MRTDAGLFTNTGEQLVNVENTSRWRRGLVIVAGIRIGVGRRETKVVGPFPVQQYGPRIEYAASPRLLVNLVDLPSLPKVMNSTDDLLGSIVCPRCGRRSHNPHDVHDRYCGACHMYHADMAATP